MCALDDVFAAYVGCAHTSMDCRSFVAMCQNSGLSDVSFNDSDAEEVFAQSITLARRRLTCAQFKDALRAVAVKKGVHEFAVMEMVVNMHKNKPYVRRAGSLPAQPRLEAPSGPRRRGRDGQRPSSAVRQTKLATRNPDQADAHQPVGPTLLTSRASSSKEADEVSCHLAQGWRGSVLTRGLPRRPALMALEALEETTKGRAELVGSVKGSGKAVPQLTPAWSDASTLSPQGIETPMSMITPGSLSTPSWQQASDNSEERGARKLFRRPACNPGNAIPCRSVPEMIRESPASSSSTSEQVMKRSAPPPLGSDMISPMGAQLVPDEHEQACSGTLTPSGTSMDLLRQQVAQDVVGNMLHKLSCNQKDLMHQCLSSKVAYVRREFRGDGGDAAKLERIFQAFCGASGGMDVHAFVKLCKACSFIGDAFSLDDARLVYSLSVPVERSDMDLPSLERALKEVAGRRGLGQRFLLSLVAACERATPVGVAAEVGLVEAQVATTEKEVENAGAFPSELRPERLEPVVRRVPGQLRRWSTTPTERSEHRVRLGECLAPLGETISSQVGCTLQAEQATMEPLKPNFRGTAGRRYSRSSSNAAGPRDIKARKNLQQALAYLGDRKRGMEVEEMARVHSEGPPPHPSALTVGRTSPAPPSPSRFGSKARSQSLPCSVEASKLPETPVSLPYLPSIAKHASAAVALQASVEAAEATSTNDVFSAQG